MVRWSLCIYFYISWPYCNRLPKRRGRGALQRVRLSGQSDRNRWAICSLGDRERKRYQQRVPASGCRTSGDLYRQPKAIQTEKSPYLKRCTYFLRTGILSLWQWYRVRVYAGWTDFQLYESNDLWWGHSYTDTSETGSDWFCRGSDHKI